MSHEIEIRIKGFEDHVATITHRIGDDLEADIASLKVKIEDWVRHLHRQVADKPADAPTDVPPAA